MTIDGAFKETGADRSAPAGPSFRPNQASSKRSAFITLVQAATKSFTNFS
jgi:hypothetical protein